MKDLLSRMDGVQTPIIPVVGQLIKANPGTISLGQGVVSYEPPREAIESLSLFLANPKNHQYQSVAGIPPLLALIQQKLAEDNRVEISDKQAIFVTAGSNMAFMNAILAITSPEDEIILNTPFYFNHEMAIKMADCQVILVATDKNYQLRPAAIEEAITEKTKAVVTISPNNPTGVVYPENTLREVNLQNLLNRVNSFDTEEPWENILSLGEQQRLAFARVLITRPSFTILDEATSALDLNNEENLYRQLQKTHTTFISVGHRESLFNYHQWVLELSSNSHWQLLTVEEYRRQKVKEIINISVDNSQTRLEDLPNQETEVNPKINSAGEPPPESPTTTILTEVEEGLSHAQMKELSDYSLSSIRSKASQGKSITGKDGLTYRYCDIYTVT